MTRRHLILPLLTLIIIAEGIALSQVNRPSSTGQTVRKHRTVVNDDPIFTPELTRAETAMDKKDYDSAEKDLLAATQKNPQNYRAWFDLGFIYNETNRVPLAIDAYRKSVEANPQIFESTLNLGLMLARAKDPDAEKYLRAATTLKPISHAEEGWYRAWLSLGQITKASKPAEAIEAFRNAAKLKPNDPEAHLSAGLLLEQQNQFAESATEYQKAAELDPKSSEALAGLVNAYTKLNQFPEAEAALRKYIALDSSNATAHVQLGRILAAEHKWDEATAELELGLKVKPGDVDAEKELAGIYLAQKFFDDAIPHLRSALKSAPNDPELHHSLGICLLNQKKFAEAQNELLAAVKLKPDFGNAYGDLAIAASGNNNYPLAIQALDARSKLLPEIPATYFLRATAFDHLKDLKRATENYKQFLAVADGRFPDEEWKARHRLIAIDPDKKKITMRQLIIAIVVASSLLAAAKEPETIDQLKARAEAAEKNKKPKLFMDLSKLQIKAADDAYNSNPEQAKSLLEQGIQSAEQAAQHSLDTGKRMKHTEIDLRKLEHRLEDIRRSWALDDREAIQPAIKRIESLRSKLLDRMFRK